MAVGLKIDEQVLLSLHILLPTSTHPSENSCRLDASAGSTLRGVRPEVGELGFERRRVWFLTTPGILSGLLPLA